MLTNFKSSLNLQLTKLQRMANFDVHYYFKNSVWLGGSQIVTAVLSLATMSALGYYLPKETFGEYRYLLSVASVIGIFYLSGYTTTITQEIAKGNLNFYTSAAKNVFYSSLIGTIISLVLSGYYIFNQNYTLGLGLLLIGVTTPFLNKYLLATSFFFGQKEFKKNAKLVLIPDIISTIVLVIVSYFNSSTVILLFSYLATNLIGNLIIHRQVTSKLEIATSTEKFSLWQLFKSFDKDSLHYSMINLIGVVGINLDKLLIFTLIGSKELAIFFFAQAIPLQARGMLRIIHNLTFSKFVNKEINILRVYSSITVLFFLGLIGVATYIVISPYIFKYLFPQYIDSIYVSQMYSLSLITYPAIYLLSGILFAKNMKEQILRLALISNFSSMVLMFASISYYGVSGLIYSAIVNSILILILNLFYVTKLSS